MKILENMLKQWIDIPKNILELTNQKIIEVESFEKLNPSTDLTIGKVLTCIDHPNSDHLHLTTVDLGHKVEQIVCGAPNVAAGQYVVVAQVGTVLPGDFEIKEAKIRGIESRGMICSLKELGIDDKSLPIELREGIYHFGKEMPIGTPALPHLYQDGFVMELGLTPNRGDLLSVLGFAYDVASMTGQKVKENKVHISEIDEKNPYEIKIDSDGCGRYYARYVKDLKVKPSPWWIRSALLANDIKPINNIVDISNYVLLEYGTPLHMFDAEKIGSKTILVRDAFDQEKVVTLDEEERILTKDDLVITNGKEPIAVAGVMGLADSMITEDTTEVLIEAAYFEPKRIQHTSKRLGLRSDSSLRFERGIDENRVLQGLERATELLIELADAKVTKGVSQAIHHEKTNPEIIVDKNYFNQSLGISLDEKTLLSYFKAYNYEVKIESNTYHIKAPSYRTDILINADLLEEIARMYGLDNIPMQSVDSPAIGKRTLKQMRIKNLRHALAELGLNEVITYALLAPKDVHLYQNIGEPVSVLLPLSEDKKTLRQSVVNGLIDVISYNQSRQHDDVFIFEIGHCFAKDKEVMHLGIAGSGTWLENKWQKEKVETDFYFFKGLIEHTFKPLNIAFTYEETNEMTNYHPYRQAKVMFKGKVIGYLAELHPSVAKEKDIKQTFVFEINLNPILEEKVEVDYQVVSKYPNVTRDLAIVIHEDIPAQKVLELIEQTVRKQIVSIDVFDVYQGITY
jgi:phenylalanyl-tRNA synthetase beta chain